MKFLLLFVIVELRQKNTNPGNYQVSARFMKCSHHVPNTENAFFWRQPYCLVVWKDSLMCWVLCSDNTVFVVELTQ